MNCKDFEMLMADALGDELAPADRPGFEAHLAECERCRHEYETSRKAITAMRALPGPQRVRVERRGRRLILHDPTYGTGSTRGTGFPAGRRVPRWLTGGLFRYAASVLIAFAAGYALHSGLMIAEFQRSDVMVSRHEGTLPEEASDESLQKALFTAHQTNPGRTSLAKCMIAMFPTKG